MDHQSFDLYGSKRELIVSEKWFEGKKKLFKCIT